MPMATNYNPDVLSCLANLSSDEVFTPPQLANQMLDLLPPELWQDPNARFLDPCSKSGVFLREIAKRLDKGLENQIPDRQARINHIMTRQLFGVAITELTALMARRSLYCSKTANGKYSVCTVFDTPEGNIRYRRIEHTWKDGRCIFCSANEQNYDRGVELETHAYEFIHTDNPFSLFDEQNKRCHFDERSEEKSMKFDVIIGNPPYQLKVGVQKENYAIPIYQLFVQQAKKLAPRFLCMIIPARWYAGGRGLDGFRREMLTDRRIKRIVDYPDATECFPGVDISGGVCYFLFDRDSQGDCQVVNMQGGQEISVSTRPLLEEGCDTFIRFNQALSILHKIKEKGENTFATLISPQTPFAIISSFRDYKREPFEGSIKIYTVNGMGYVSEDVVIRNKHMDTRVESLHRKILRRTRQIPIPLSCETIPG